MEDIENYTSLQEFTEDISHSGNRPILTSQGKQGNMRVHNSVRTVCELEGRVKYKETCGTRQSNNQ